MKTAFQNLNWAVPETHDGRIDQMVEQGADFVGVCELVHPMRRVNFHEYQPHQGGGSEGILVQRNYEIMRKRNILASPNKFGQEIGWRRIIMVVVSVPGVGVVAFIVLHMPPKRMWGPLYAAYAYRLRRFIRRNCFSQGIRKVAVYADWNKDLAQDPAALQKTFGFHWYGDPTRIDGIAVSEALKKYVKNAWQEEHENRMDNHPTCWMVFG